MIFDIENNMMSSSCGNDNFLPDLGTEKDSDHIVFEQKVFRNNEKFIHINQAIINWFKSPADNREYPKVAYQNKNAYKNKMKSYLF